MTLQPLPLGWGQCRVGHGPVVAVGVGSPAPASSSPAPVGAWQRRDGISLHPDRAPQGAELLLQGRQKQ